MSQNNSKKISPEDLKKFDGTNGQPLYIVYKDKVYDLSSSKLWLQGKHMGTHLRTDDLTEAIKAAPHGEDNVFRYPLVGEFTGAILPAPPQPALNMLSKPKDERPFLIAGVDLNKLLARLNCKP